MSRRAGAFLFGGWCKQGWAPRALWGMTVIFPPSGSVVTLPMQPGPVFAWRPAAVRHILCAL